MESKTKWFRVGRWALYVGPGPVVPQLVIQTQVTYYRRFWRFFSIGPGLSRDEFLKLIVLNRQ